MPTTENHIEAKLLSIARDFLLALHVDRAFQALTLEASLERYLGIDSFGKRAPFHQIEAAMSISTARTSDDIV